MLLKWVGDIFIVGGLWGIGNRQRNAFWLSMIGEGLWIAASVGSGDWALVSICCVFFGMAVRSYVKWAS